jgi:hypothetical protein
MKTLLVLCVMFIVGCTCSNEIDTPRDISKEPHGSIKFINVSHVEIDMRCYFNELESKYTNTRSLLSSIDPDPSTPYNDVPEGSAIIQVTSRTGKPILNAPLFFHNGSKLSLVLFGGGSQINAALFTDDLESKKNGKVYLRLINVSPDSLDAFLYTDSQQTPPTSFAYASSFLEVDTLTKTVTISSEARQDTVDIFGLYPFKHVSVITHEKFSGKRYSIVKHD